MSLILIERIANLNGPIIPDTLNGVLNGSEIDAHKFIITATRDGAQVALTGTVTASFLRADGAEVVLTGEIENGAATVTLAQSCYAVPGRFDLTIFVTADGVKTGVYACTGGVRNTTSGTIVDPGQIVPSVDDIIAKQEELAQDVADASSAIASAQNAVSYLAPVFSTSQTYAVGEYVTKDGALYVCTTAVETAGAWDAANWQAVTFGGEVTNLKNALQDSVDLITDELNVNFNAQSTYRANITSGGNWQTTAGSNLATSSIIVIPDCVKKIIVRAVNGCNIAFLNSFDASNFSGAVDFATGYTSRIIVAANTEREFMLPHDANYIFVTRTNSSGTNITPAVVMISSTVYNIADLQTKMASTSRIDLSLVWDLGHSVDADGEPITIGSAAISSYIKLEDISNAFYRGGALTDTNGNILNCLIAEYNGSTFISRTLFNSLDVPFGFNENCTQFRVIFGYSSAAGISMTQEIIDAYFDPYTYLNGTSVNNKINRLQSILPDYSGKRLSILGDSISTFAASNEKTDGKAADGCTTNYPGNPVQYSNSDVTNVESTWWGKVIDQFGMVLGINESWAGSCIGYNPNQTASGKYTADNCLCSITRIGHLGENGTPDIIIVFGGTNDINHHKVGSGNTLRYAVGELDSEHNPYDYDNFPMVTETYYGSITTMLLRIQHTYPNATILMILPYFCTYTHTSSGDRATPYDQNEWSKAAIDVCKYLGVEYLDLRSIINLYDVSALLFDGLHPKANGMAAIANAVIHKLNSML